MVPYHRPKSGHITCYLNRTYHVLLTAIDKKLDSGSFNHYQLMRDSPLTNVIVPRPHHHGRTGRSLQWSRTGRSSAPCHAHAVNDCGVDVLCMSV